MTARILIGLTGKPLSGKTAIAESLVRDHGFERRRIGRPMRQMLAALMEYRGAPDAAIAAWLEQDKDKPCPWLNGATPRRALQSLGEDWANAVAPGIWMNATLDAMGDEGCYVIDDVRRRSEADAIRAAGGVVLRVTRGGPGLETADAAHPAENHEVEVDWSIENNGTIEEAVAEVVRWRSLLAPRQQEIAP